MLKQRLITGVSMALLFLAMLFFLPTSAFAVLVGAVLVVCAWEWANLAGLESQFARCVYALVIAVLTLLTGFQVGVGEDTFDRFSVQIILLVTTFWWLLAYVWVRNYPRLVSVWNKPPVKILAGVLVLVPAWLALIYLHSQPHGRWLIVLNIAAVAVSDTGAYFVGKSIGRRKLAPRVSPGKSWEGLYGGFVCCMILAAVVFLLYGGGWTLFLLFAAASLFSVLGDLSESMFKRQRGLKDSSNLLPGHGGFLDRMDGITAAAPVFALIIVLTGWQF